jgi:hypothetical protein
LDFLFSSFKRIEFAFTLYCQVFSFQCTDFCEFLMFLGLLCICLVKN